MADAPERPTSVTTAPFPDPPPALPDAGSDEPYRPISMLAIAGLVLAVLFSFLVVLGGLGPLAGRFPRLFLVLLLLAPLGGLLVGLLTKQREVSRLATYAGVSLAGLATFLGLGGLVAFSGANPWLLNWIWWGVALGAIILCLLARSRITASEGTLSGTPLANWGLALTLFFGLNYAAYLTSNTFAIRGQARQCAEEFLTLIRDTKDPDAQLQAFLRTLPVRERPTSDIRQAVEVTYNISRDAQGSQPGLFSGFRHMSFVRMLRQGPCDVRFDRVERSAFSRGGYEVDLIYRIDTRMGAFEMVVGTVGQETADGRGTRQWHVELTRAALIRNLSQTAEGAKFEFTSSIAKGFAYEWFTKIRANQKVAVYMDTLSPEQRVRSTGTALLQEQALIGMTGVGLGGAWGPIANQEEFRKGLETFLKGSLVDGKDMWAAREEVKAEMLQDAISVITGDGSLVSDISPYSADVPYYRENGDESEFSYPIRILTRKAGEIKGRFLLEAEVVITGPMSSVLPQQLPYRISKVRIIRGQSAPDPRSAPGTGG